MTATSSPLFQLGALQANVNEDIIKLTDNNFDDFSPQISGNNVAWTAYPDFNDSEIYFYDGKSVIQLTNNDTYESSPQISGNKVVWSSYDGNDEEIYLYDGSKIVQLTDNNFSDYSPQISGNKVVWTTYDGNDEEIYLYDGSKIVQLTDNNFSDYSPQISGNKIVWSGYTDNADSEIYLYDGQNTIRLTNNDIYESNPQISGNNIVWTAYDGNDEEIYFYDGSNIIQLTDNNLYDYNPQISGNKIVWYAYPSDFSDSEIYLYDGNNTIQLTDNDFGDYSPQISGNNVVWYGNPDNLDGEIFLYDGSSTSQLTDNDFEDSSPEISGNKVVWSGYDGSDYEIYRYDIVPGIVLVGTEDDDVLTGGKGGDTISGLGGNDLLQGLGGKDLISGGNGDDLIVAGSGSDTAEGGLGNDTISGNSGEDSLSGNDGRDNIVGGDGDDTIDGGKGKDRLLGEDGNDTISGQAEDDTIDGGEGSDSVTGGTGSDRIFGGSANDSLSGGDGADSLRGGLDSDTLDGGKGNDSLIGVEPSGTAFGAGELDVLSGGSEQDTFILGEATRVYYDDGDPLNPGESDYGFIKDFDSSKDSIQLQGTADLYSLDFFTSSNGTIDAALIFDSGDTARSEVIGILQNVSSDLKISDPAFKFIPGQLSQQPNRANPDSNSDAANNESSLDRLDGLKEGQDYVAGEVIVKLKSGADLTEINTIQANLGVTVLETTQTLGIQRWSLAETTVREVLAMFDSSPTISDAIEYIEPNFIGTTSAKVPNDPRFGELWGLDNTGQSGGVADADIDAPEAWDIQTGKDVVVGVIDTGVDYNHPDLNDNMWTNSGETPNNGVDDDNNGYVDDYYGYDFVNEDGDPFDDAFHGTHVSGTIAAEGNNDTGVSGVNWDARIMGIKFLDSGGFGTYFDAIESIEYATKMGVKVSNNSWRGYEFSQGLYDAIAAAGQAGHLFVAAAGNETTDNDGDFRAYPASFDLNNIISVAATDRNDALAGFSNFGATSVDLGAPGVETLSTFPGGDYGSLDGTSMATPHVAGVASLLWSEDPSLSAQEVKDLILNTVDPLAALAGKTLTGGRLNAFNALSELKPPTEIIGTEDDDVLNGTNRRDNISGLGGDDVIQGFAGNDKILGGNGNDLISAGIGDDTVEGGTGNDQVFGNDGDDSLLGNNGRDNLVAGDGNDSLDGGADADRLLGEEGNDKIEGKAGNDTLDGGDDKDSLNGGIGSDRLFGGEGNDNLVGEDGADLLRGGLDDDSLNGGNGNDRLIGVDPVVPGSDIGFGAGELDVLTGISGRDTFVLGDATRVYYDDGDPLTTGEPDYATVTDFDVTQDFIELHGTADLYSLDFFTSTAGTTDAALIYDPGVAARGEVIGILQNVSVDLTFSNSAFVFV